MTTTIKEQQAQPFMSEAFMAGGELLPFDPTSFCDPTSFAFTPLENFAFDCSGRQQDQQSCLVTTTPPFGTPLDLWDSSSNNSDKHHYNVLPASPPESMIPVEKVAIDSTFASATVTQEMERQIGRNVLLSVMANSADALTYTKALFPETNDSNNHTVSAAPVSLPASLPRLQPAATSKTTQMTATPINNNPSYHLEVSNFTKSHFAKDRFPPFRVAVSRPDGTPIARKDMPQNIHISITVHNKWADVTEEVSPSTVPVRLLEHGEAIVNDLVFNEVSMRHGGHFTVKIGAVFVDDDNNPTTTNTHVLPWESDNILIQSVKTHCNLKRKLKQAQNGQQVGVAGGKRKKPQTTQQQSPVLPLNL